MKTKSVENNVPPGRICWGHKKIQNFDGDLAATMCAKFISISKKEIGETGGTARDITITGMLAEMIESSTEVALAAGRQISHSTRKREGHRKAKEVCVCGRESP